MAESISTPKFGLRLASLIYEIMLMLAMALVVSTFFTWLKSRIGASFWEDQVFRLIILGVLFGYYGMSWVKSGQTVATKAWGVKLVTADGRPFTWGIAAFRFLVVLALFVGVPVIAYLGMGGIAGSGDVKVARLALLWCAVPFAWAWIDPQAQFLHDRLCGTRQVTAPKAPIVKKKKTK